MNDLLENLLIAASQVLPSMRAFEAGCEYTEMDRLRLEDLLAAINAATSVHR